jgi:predicted lipoprotein with Yx(FWY)xxD motif
MVCERPIELGRLQRQKGEDELLFLGEVADDVQPEVTEVAGCDLVPRARLALGRAAELARAGEGVVMVVREGDECRVPLHGLLGFTRATLSGTWQDDAGVQILMRRLLAAAAVLVVLAALVAAGSPASIHSKEHRAAKTVTVSTRSVKGLGTVLVDSRGLTLYMFVRDKRKKVTCTSTSCVALWPPLKLPTGAKPLAAGKAKQALLSSDPNPKGGRVVTYARWPLYTYAGDTKPGQATGQALNLNGGLWYVLSPSGVVIKKKP